MSPTTNKILSNQSTLSSESRTVVSEAATCSNMLREFVSGERERGLPEALNRAHLKTGISERRLLTIYQRKAPRVWADEFHAIRRMYETWAEQREARVLHELEMLRARRAMIGPK